LPLASFSWSVALIWYGAAIALPIAALGLFVGLRAWSLKLGKETAAEAEGWLGKPQAKAPPRRRQRKRR
jgi:hypothetical protein